MSSPDPLHDAARRFVDELIARLAGVGSTIEHVRERLSNLEESARGQIGRAESHDLRQRLGKLEASNERLMARVADLERARGQAPAPDPLAASSRGVKE